MAKVFLMLDEGEHDYILSELCRAQGILKRERADDQAQRVGGIIDMLAKTEMAMPAGEGLLRQTRYIVRWLSDKLPYFLWRDHEPIALGVVEALDKVIEGEVSKRPSPWVDDGEHPVMPVDTGGSR